MTTDLALLAYSALLTWLMLLVASALHTKTWTLAGIKLGLGNRDDLPERSPVAGRADRAAKNMLENLVLFAALLFAARAAGADRARIELAAQLFFWARLVYFPLYLAGIRYLRTVVWTVGVVGLALLFAAAV
jgi:uncharacterized MAPEG superfamily protein